MKTPHKHCELIKAWADGAEIEACSILNGKWVYMPGPLWSPNCEYRIKPEPKPDLVEHYSAEPGMLNFSQVANLKLTFDGETGKLIKAEVL